MVKIKLIYEAGPEEGVMVEVKVLPRVGEKLVMGTSELEVIQVVHTPTSDVHTAIVVLREL